MEHLSDFHFPHFEADCVLDSLPFSVRAVGCQSFPTAVFGCCFLYLAHGSAAIVLSGSSLPMQAGDLLMIQADVPFVCMQQENADWYWLDGIGHALPTLLTVCNLVPHRVFHLPEDSRIPARYVAIQQAVASGDRLCPLSAAAHFLDLLVSFGSSICPADWQSNEIDPLADILQELQRSFSADYSVQELADRCHVSVGRFSMLFKARTGVSPQRYIIDLRLAHAQHLLRHTALSIQQIATASGYSDAFYFSRLFRRHIGQSPSAFRKNPHQSDAL